MVGRRLAEAAGRHLKRVVLQLSGQNALIVLADADLTYAVDAAVYGAFVHQGQICMCARRIWSRRPSPTSSPVASSRRWPRCRPAIRPTRGTVIGPLINKWALSLISRRVDEAVDLGARVLVGGTAAAAVLPGHGADRCDPAAEIAFEETFGPVAILEVVADADDAIRRANASRFGLTAGILTGDPYRGCSSPAGSSPGSSTSTTSRSTTSRRCPSAG